MVRYRSPERVIEEMELGIKNNATQFIFIDDTFLLDKKRAMELSHLLIKKGLHKRITWACLSRADIVDEELLTTIKEAGCTMVYFGVESGSQYILDNIGKNITLEEIKHAFSLAKAVGLKTVAFFMIGTPYETKETIMSTRRFISELNPDFLELSIFTPYPGTEFYSAIKQGLEGIVIVDTSWSNFNMTRSEYIRHKNFGSDELEVIKWTVYVRFYMHPSRITRIVSRIRSPRIIFRMGGWIMVFFVKRIVKKIGKSMQLFQTKAGSVRRA